MATDYKLVCLIEGESGPFSVTVSRDGYPSDLKEKIAKERERSLKDVDAHTLKLWKVNIDLQTRNAESISFLRVEGTEGAENLVWLPMSNYWPQQPPPTHLQIIVQIPGTVPQAVPNKNRRELKRELVLTNAKGRPAPSTSAKLDKQREVQKPVNEDAIYNHRPLSLSAESIMIYHSVFTEFVNDISTPPESRNYTHKELSDAADVIQAATQFYRVEDLRVEALRATVGKSLGEELFIKSTVAGSTGISAQPDGLLKVVCSGLPDQPLGYYCAQEANNESGEGGSDSVAQAECVYRAIVSTDTYAAIREASCCPMFLVSITGPVITVSGAVFTDRLICQRLTDTIFLGPRHSTVGELSALDKGQRKVAQLIAALRKGLDVLKKNYETLEPMKLGNKFRFPSPPQFQSYDDLLTGKTHKLVYCERLARDYPETAIFRAITVGSQEPQQVVVKFTCRYGKVGHIKLAEVSLAPVLRFCEYVHAVGMFVVVMDYVSDDPEPQGDYPELWKTGLKKGLEVLHGNNLVFGDLRLPNLLMHEGAIKFIDFDWCGEEGVARYPGDLSEDPEHGWHSDVERNGIMKKVHDIHMWKNILRPAPKRRALDEDSTRETKLARR